MKSQTIIRLVVGLVSITLIIALYAAIRIHTAHDHYDTDAQPVDIVCGEHAAFVNGHCVPEMNR